MSARQSGVTDQAIKLVEGGMTRYAAAIKVGITYATMHKAWNRHLRAREAVQPVNDRPATAPTVEAPIPSSVDALAERDGLTRMAGESDHALRARIEALQRLRGRCGVVYFTKVTRKQKMENDRPVLTEAMLEAGREALFRFRTQPMYEDACFIDSEGVQQIWLAIWLASSARPA